MTTTEGKRATYKQRYEEGDDGLRFQELTYTGNFHGMEPVTDGIKGDKMMKSRAKSGVLEKVSKEDVLRDQFTIDELNDLNNYLAWNIWDVLVMRATEGVSGMIPRQEYEILAFMHEFYRWPEILRMTTEEAGGAQAIMDIGASARREIGTKVNAVHDWCIGAVGFGMGRCGLLALEVIGPDDLPHDIRQPQMAGTKPRRERRRTVADDLYKRLVDEQESFWHVVYPMYMQREITRDNVREIVRRGLEEERGNYRIVAKLFNMAPNDYKRFLNFLRKHNCQLPFKEYR